MNSGRSPILLIIVVIALIAGGVLWYTNRGASLPALGGQDADTAALNQTLSLNGVSITPKEVLEDSRCPLDVQCIQAGTVRLNATLASGLGTGDQVFTLGQAITTEAETVTLTAVAPDKYSKVQIQPGEYRFTFSVTKR